MAEKKLVNINWVAVWVAVSALAAAVVATVTVIQILDGPVPLINPPELTAKIESYPYRHAGPVFSVTRSVWREKWVQPLEQRLKELNLAPDVGETVVAAMEDLIREKVERELGQSGYRIQRARKWYDVTIRNNGDVPLKGVFLRFPQAVHWIDDTGRLSFVPQRIEIGDMEQKTEKRYVFWGGTPGSFGRQEKPVLGHSNGIGIVNFD